MLDLGIETGIGRPELRVFNRRGAAARAHAIFRRRIGAAGRGRTAERQQVLLRVDREGLLRFRERRDAGTGIFITADQERKVRGAVGRGGGSTSRRELRGAEQRDRGTRVRDQVGCRLLGHVGERKNTRTGVVTENPLERNDSKVTRLARHDRGIGTRFAQRSIRDEGLQSGTRERRHGVGTRLSRQRSRADCRRHRSGKGVGHGNRRGVRDGRIAAGEFAASSKGTCRASRQGASHGGVRRIRIDEGGILGRKIDHARRRAGPVDFDDVARAPIGAFEDGIGAAQEGNFRRRPPGSSCRRAR